MPVVQCDGQGGSSKEGGYTEEDVAAGAGVAGSGRPDTSVMDNPASLDIPRVWC